MKFDLQKSFPYPVLRPYSDDYQDSEFQVDVAVGTQDGEIRVRTTHVTSSESILQLIEEKAAKYVTVISCRDTYLRIAEVSSLAVAEVSISAKKLRGEVAIDCFVVAVTDIPGYRPEDLNSEYGDGSFKIEAGSVLAQEETHVFYFDRELLKPVSSVFDIVVQEQMEPGRWSIDFNADRVRIGMSRETKATVDLARSSKEHRAVLINSLYFSAVMSCLEAMKSSPDDVRSYRWFEVFDHQIQDAGLDLEAQETYFLAQELLRKPMLLLMNYVFKD